jgi:hypothetical protein
LSTRIRRGCGLLELVCCSVAACLNECMGTTRSSSVRTTEGHVYIFKQAQKGKHTISCQKDEGGQDTIGNVVKWGNRINEVKVVRIVRVSIVAYPCVP